ncbi:hypothetical protein BSR29_08070 [Boudabousia liubingyangii]|uniref:Septum formation initiator family protein n=1 Tax=Boudabousia liubingyangii TaxID=1921764 RepID=A0A1Q5PJT7_9ACTO|nr:septum formation initiator family protein [Boudabousia liubingyangii]OKL46195.1 hypothetical protein BSR29_08070 [Boudabousia liubingyangii]
MKEQPPRGRNLPTPKVRIPKRSSSSSTPSRSPEKASTTSNRPTGSPATRSRQKAPITYATSTGLKTSRGEISYRAFSIILVLIVLAAFLVSPVKQLLQQEQSNRRMLAQIEAEKEKQAELKEMLARWDDPDYVAAQARERLGYLRPGQTQYVVIDPDSKFLNQKTVEAPFQGPVRPWFLTLSESIAAAGASPKLTTVTTPTPEPQPANSTPEAKPSPE